MEVDPLVVKKTAEEAEERRLAELRAHGTPVTPSTFAEWKARFAVEMAQARARHVGEADGRDAGASGKAYFRQMDAVSIPFLVCFPLRSPLPQHVRTAVLWPAGWPGLAR